MILRAFDVEFHEEKAEIPPRTCRPSKSKEKRQFAWYGHKQVKQNHVDKVGSPPARPSARAGGAGDAAPREKTKDNVHDMGLKKWIKTNVDKVGSPPARPSARAGGPGAAAPQEEKKAGWCPTAKS